MSCINYQVKQQAKTSTLSPFLQQEGTGMYCQLLQQSSWYTTFWASYFLICNIFSVLLQSTIIKICVSLLSFCSHGTDFSSANYRWSMQQNGKASIHWSNNMLCSVPSIVTHAHYSYCAYNGNMWFRMVTLSTARADHVTLTSSHSLFCKMSI